uniref:Uncharacterized protein n=1 Tax=Arundo donax TaxID=35708 RepID=A0A0A9A2D9_ARUDO
MLVHYLFRCISVMLFLLPQLHIKGIISERVAF